MPHFQITADQLINDSARDSLVTAGIVPSGHEYHGSRRRGRSTFLVDASDAAAAGRLERPPLAQLGASVMAVDPVD